MKVITLMQPWATLVAEGYKLYEFRSWKTNYRGEILIHAGKGIDKEAMKKFESLKLNYPKSQIIAKVTIGDCIKLNEEICENIIKENPDFYDEKIQKYEYVWEFNNVKKVILKEKINGKQGFWSIEL